MFGLGFQGLACAGAYVATKLLVRWVWYKPEHDRPGFLRHFFPIRALDFAANLVLCAAFFFVLNTNDIGRAVALTIGLLLYDIVLRQCFLHVEARKLCAHSRHPDLKQAKQRLRRRARQESPF